MCDVCGCGGACVCVLHSSTTVMNYLGYESSPIRCSIPWVSCLPPVSLTSHLICIGWVNAQSLPCSVLANSNNLVNYWIKFLKQTRHLPRADWVFVKLPDDSNHSTVDTWTRLHALETRQVNLEHLSTESSCFGVLNSRTSQFSC